jgi:hypothetical protein
MPPPTSHTSSSTLPSSAGTARPRLRLCEELVTSAARHLTERDRYICSLLAEHRVLTTDQITAVAFDSPVTARHRLSTLYRLRFLDRFRPFRRVGTAPNHWVLDAIGAAVVAAERGVEVEDLRWRRDRSLGLQSSSQLAHRVGTNGFFCSLLGASRHAAEAELRVWWPERRCLSTWGEVVRPDGYGVWAEASTEVAFFLEYDRGTETLDRLAAKLDGYATLAAAAKDPFWVLFWFPSARREAGARKVLAGSSVPVATGCHSDAPTGAVWLATNGGDGGRRRLSELPAVAASRRVAR